LSTKRPVFTAISLLVAGALLASCATVSQGRSNESAANLPFETCLSDADTCFSWSTQASQECIDNYPLLLTEENRLARGPFEECVYELDFLGIEHLTPERFMGPVSEIAKENAKKLQSLGWDRAQASPRLSSTGISPDNQISLLLVLRNKLGIFIVNVPDPLFRLGQAFSELLMPLNELSNSRLVRHVEVPSLVQEMPNVLPYWQA
jgi:hypothetical protein